ncbi:MAG: ATP-grasp domain-containing protein [Planctomycetes bacterium]|nr:ATP-grasp domain-containing protein [Planctomycetota bacterium]
MNPVLLFRKSYASKYELLHAEKYFRVEESRMSCQNSLVIGRYSVLPFYEELERDLSLIGSRLINSLAEHRWITSFAYYREMQGHTPETWDDENIHACVHPGPFVVKGKMSSKKHHWNTHMFAETKREALELAGRLKMDADIREQGVVYRKYVPLKTLEVGVHGLRHTNEWRFYCYQDCVLSYGYYWSAANCWEQAVLKPEGLQLAHKLARMAADFATFFTLDIAETEEGDWILIEINDAQMAAPSENDLDELYGRLKEKVQL